MSGTMSGGNAVKRMGEIPAKLNELDNMAARLDDVSIQLVSSLSGVVRSEPAAPAPVGTKPGPVGRMTPGTDVGCSLDSICNRIEDVIERIESALGRLEL